MTLQTILKAGLQATASLVLIHSILGCSTPPAMQVRMIDAAPVNTFPAWNNATLASYPNERAKMDRAAERYFGTAYEIADRRAYVAGAFSRSLQSSLRDVLNVKLGAKTIDHRLPPGLASITIWKRGKEYFAVAESEIIYPGANGIYGYYELCRKIETRCR